MAIDNTMELWRNEERFAFEGWDFSHLQSRWQHSALPWDYKSLITENLLPPDRLLDMGTGGGEFLCSLKHPYKNTTVTESWAPNIALCLQRLAPLGIRVLPLDEGAPLPVADNAFDFVINRQASYDLAEIRRVLKPGGLLITQQVGGENCVDLQRRLCPSSPKAPSFSLETERLNFVRAGFSLQYTDEAFPTLKFFDVGAIVFFAKIITWTFPNFSVEKNFDCLCALQRDIDRFGFVSTTEHRFVLVARNMKTS